MNPRSCSRCSLSKYSSQFDDGDVVCKLCRAEETKRQTGGWVVRIVVSFEEAQRLDVMGFLYLLDKAGLIHLHRNDKDGACFDLIPPANDPSPEGWIRGMCERLVTHGFNAVRAPRMQR